MRRWLVVILVGGCDPIMLDTGPEDLARPTVAVRLPDLADPLPDLARPPVDLAQPPPDMTCGGMTFALQRIQPNVMLVLDRSGSMGDPIATGSATSKWQDLKSALTSLVGKYDAQVRFGVDLFQGASNCAPGPVALTCAPAHGGDVMTRVNAATTGGNTPTAVTLDQIIQHGMLDDSGRQNVVVLATDGMPNCGDTDVAGRITTLFKATPSVKTFVIGVGSGTAADPDLLNAWAVAGHTDLPGATKYFQTNSPTDLQKAFDTIAVGLVSCVFTLSAPVPDPTQVYVWENGAPVAADATSGFSYEDAGPTVTLHGAACDALKTAPSTNVQVTYGCPTPPPVS